MKFIPNAVSSRVARQALVAQKHSPTILFGVGIVGFGATVVLASRATLKLDEVLQRTEKNISEAKTALVLNPEEYREQDYQKDMATIYILSAVEIIKLYSPAIMTGVASVGALSKSHNILNKRNAAVTAAYAALEKGFAEYRDRVVEELGEEADDRFQYGQRQIEVEEETKDGKIKKSTKKVAKDISVYAKFFDENCPDWSKEPEYNRLFIQCQQNYANDLLIARGHVFLNEVYDMLGIERTNAGAVVGWLLEGTDGYVDFGVFRGESAAVRDFVNGNEGSILLDFNVDGVIWDKI